jgi:small subunit ribosomal protein S20
MAVTKSAAKRILTSENARVRHKSRNSALKTAEKKLRKAASETGEKAQGMYSKISGMLDKAVKSGTIHKNKANRKKSRLARVVNSGKK